MRVQGETAAWGTGVGVGAQTVTLGWLQRLRRWWAGPAMLREHILAVKAYRSWEGPRAQFRPPYAEAAVEHAARQGGQFWTVTLYNSLL